MDSRQILICVKIFIHPSYVKLMEEAKCCMMALVSGSSFFSRRTDWWSNFYNFKIRHADSILTWLINCLSQVPLVSSLTQGTHTAMLPPAWLVWTEQPIKPLDFASRLNVRSRVWENARIFSGFVFFSSIFNLDLGCTLVHFAVIDE